MKDFGAGMKKADKGRAAKMLYEVTVPNDRTEFLAYYNQISILSRVLSIKDLLITKITYFFLTLDK